MSRKLEFHFPEFYPSQKELVFATEKLVCSLASVQCGKTAALLCYAIYQALRLGEGKTIWWIAPFSNTSLIAWRRLILQVENNLPKDMYQINVQYRYIDFKKHARIKFISADNTAGLFGETCDMIIADEAGLISQESWSAILSRTTQTDAPIRCASNLHGKNWYYQLCMDIKTHKILDSKYIEITVDEPIKYGIIKQSTIDRIKSTMPLGRFNELYYCIAQDNESLAFDPSDIDACIVDTYDPTSPVIAYGLDLGKTVDFTALAGISLDNTLIKLDYWGKKTWEYTINRVCLVDNLSTVPILVDSTGLGDVVLEQLQNRLDNCRGYVFTPKSKTKLIETLQIAIQNKSIKIPRKFEELITELKNYGSSRNELGYISYNATKGHDDLVISTALAVYCKSKYLQTCSFLPTVLSTEPINYANELGWKEISSW